MLRFPICWEIPPACATLMGVFNTRLLKLNNEWEMECTFDQNGREPQSIRIRRQITSEDALVSGTLSVGRSGQKDVLSTQVFSQSIELGSSFIIINFNYPPPSTTALRTEGIPNFSYEPISLPTFCVLSGIVYITSISEESKKCTQQKSLVQLSNDFERLLDPQSSCLTDVNLKCSDASIPAHKLILSTRSPVFAAMFANEMKEKHENQVDITDMAAYAVRAMVIYIYTGKTYNLTMSSAPDLLFAADKYQLEDLNRVCCEFLKENVSLQNVLRILVLGDLHAKDLKSFAIDYICNKCSDFSAFESSEEWETLRKERPDLAIDVLTSIVKSRDRKASLPGL